MELFIYLQCNVNYIGEYKFFWVFFLCFCFCFFPLVWEGYWKLSVPLLFPIIETGASSVEFPKLSCVSHWISYRWMISCLIEKLVHF